MRWVTCSSSLSGSHPSGASRERRSGSSWDIRCLLSLAALFLPARANSDKSRSATRRLVSLGYTVDGLPGMETSVRAVDEAVLGRLRLAIDAEAGNEEEQLDGVLRMLGAIGGGVESVHGQPYGEDP